MTLQMHYQEKFDQGVQQGVEQSNEESAQRMLEDGELSPEKIAKYSGLTLEQVLKMKEEMTAQPV